METCLRSLPRRSNFTLPDFMANRVSSLPLPTFTPGWMWVPLTDQNVAGQHELTVAALHAQTLGLRVAAVPGGANALFMGEKLQTDIQHSVTPPKR